VKHQTPGTKSHTIQIHWNLVRRGGLEFGISLIAENQKFQKDLYESFLILIPLKK